jgi:hypothetical protein
MHVCVATWRMENSQDSGAFLILQVATLSSSLPEFHTKRIAWGFLTADHDRAVYLNFRDALVLTVWQISGRARHVLGKCKRNS